MYVLKIKLVWCPIFNSSFLKFSFTFILKFLHTDLATAPNISHCHVTIQVENFHENKRCIGMATDILSSDTREIWVSDQYTLCFEANNY